VKAFLELERPVVWAVHPRTRKNLESFGLVESLDGSSAVRLVQPLPYTDTIALLRGSAGLLTDSGGMQKEAYFFGVPCVTLRDETEWTETVELGWNVLVGTDEQKIVKAASLMSRPDHRPDVYGEGHTADAIVSVLEQRYEN